MRLRTLTVKELSAYIAQSINLDQILRNINVEGEISNFKIHSSGHVYFSLKDEQTKINCIIFNASSSMRLEDLAEGDKVLCQGSINYYDREGYINLIVNQIEKLGEGEAYQNFLLLKKNLMEKGLFEEEFKRPLPFLPRKIGIITSPTGAVIRDIYYVIKRRFPKVELILYPARVQGEGAPAELIAGVDYFQDQEVDLIILARGGGSYEDLSAFNDEALAYKIFESKIPLISAVGHETDFTIADFVADLRASTPSVAAELAVPRLEDLIYDLDKRLEELEIALYQRVDRIQLELDRLGQILESKSPLKLIDSYQAEVKSKGEIMGLLVQAILRKKESLLEQKVNAIFLKNPQTVYELGGAYLRDKDGEKIRSKDEISLGMELKVSLKDGDFIVGVLEK